MMSIQVQVIQYSEMFDTVIDDEFYRKYKRYFRFVGMETSATCEHQIIPTNVAMDNFGDELANLFSDNVDTSAGSSIQQDVNTVVDYEILSTIF